MLTLEEELHVVNLYEELGSYRAVAALVGCDHKTSKRRWKGWASLRYSGGIEVPPHSSGALSATVSEKVHWWPAGSSAVYWRSPYS